MKMVAATKNKGKMKEFQDILRDAGVELISQAEAGVDIDVVEDGATFEENSLKKARELMEATGLPALADDSGLCVDFLDGAPGIYSARYGGGHGNDDKNNELLLKNMESAEDGERTARFVSVISVCFPDGREPIQARGEVEGVILRECRGEGGFGYDPVFYLPAFGRTMAELSLQEKDKISHRARALTLCKEKLKEINYA